MSDANKPPSSCMETSDSATVKSYKLDLNLHVSKQRVPQRQTSICWKPARLLPGCHLKTHEPVVHKRAKAPGPGSTFRDNHQRY